MIRMMLTCATGISSRNFAQKIAEEAKEMGIEAEVYSCTVGTLNEELDNIDVLLVGPQIRFKLPEINDVVNNKFPVIEIDTLDFNILKCRKIVESAIEAVNNFKK